MTNENNYPTSGKNKFVETHGLSRSPEYSAWRDMLQRCRNKKCKAYVNYGARGITVSDSWIKSFAAFLKDVGFRPSPKHSIDRIDNDKGYSKENCRWALKSVQMRNQRPRKNKKYRGVYFDKKLNRYIARIHINGKCKYLGSFLTEHDAGIAYKLKFQQVNTGAKDE